MHILHSHKTTIITFILCGILMILFSCASNPSLTDKGRKEFSPLLPYTMKKLPNGLTVIVKEVHTSPIVAVHFWCNTGSVNEEKFPAGISHFFEHMFFKGTEKMGVGEMDRIVKSLGGYNNAFTSKEYTGYYIVVPSENYSVAFDILLDAIRNSVFDPQEIEREREVINEEINRAEDLPDSKVHNELYEILFQGTPYAPPVLGTKESLASLGRDDFKRYLGTFYVPNNITVVVVGDISEKKIIGQIEKATEDWKMNPSVKEQFVRFTFDPQDTVRSHELNRDINLVYWALGFSNRGLQNRRELYTLDVVTSILGEGRSSSLYRRLIEKEGLVSGVSCYIAPMKMGGAVIINAVFPLENEEKVRQIVFEELARMKEGQFTDEELNRAKTMLKVDFAFDNETVSQIAQTFGYFVTVGHLENALEYEKQIESVTRDEVITFCKESFRFDAYSEVFIRPNDEAN